MEKTREWMASRLWSFIGGRYGMNTGGAGQRQCRMQGAEVMGHGKATELSEAEIKQIRERLQRYLDRASYDCENYADNGNVRISIEPEDNFTIYKAVHSGNESLKRLACEVVYRTNRIHFREQAKKYLKNLDDREEAVQELLGVELYKDIEKYDPTRASITVFLELRAMTVFQRKFGETIGLKTKHFVDAAIRVNVAKEQIYKKTGVENPSEYDILEQDKRAGRHEKNLSLNAVRTAMESAKHVVSTSQMEEVGLELPASSRNEPHNVFAERESDKKLRTALSRIELRYRRIIIKALELNALAPVEANKQLISFVRTTILKDAKATDERAQIYIEAAYNEFRRAMSAASGPRRGEMGNRRKLSFTRALSRDVYERETQDIMAALEEDVLKD